MIAGGPDTNPYLSGFENMIFILLNLQRNSKLNNIIIVFCKYYTNGETKMKSN